MTVPIQNQPRFSGFFKFSKTQEGNVLSSLNSLKFFSQPLSYFKVAAPEKDEFVIAVADRSDIAVAGALNHNKPNPISYEYQSVPFLTREEREGAKAREIEIIKHNNEMNNDNIKRKTALMLAEAELLKQKRKTVFGFLKGCFTTNL